jgi:hypothetical protein
VERQFGEGEAVLTLTGRCGLFGLVWFPSSISDFNFEEFILEHIAIILLHSDHSRHVIERHSPWSEIRVDGLSI